MTSGDKTKYWIGFNRVTGIGPVRLRRLLDVFGNIETAWKASHQALRDAGLNLKLVNTVLKAREEMNLDRETERLDKLGIGVITWDDERYPDRLKEIDSSPPLLYISGSLEPIDRYAVAIVGTRRLSPYGESITREISGGLAANGITIVSGLALGIDGIAHQAALDVGGRTLAILGSGLDLIYPPKHRQLAQNIRKQGAVLSDYPLGTKPEGRNFPPRNRIISGLSLAVIVVEAGESSGALITANFAAEQSRDVFAVPGNIHSRASKGTNRLIYKGAIPFLSIVDVLETLNLELIARQEQVEDYLPENDIESVIYEKLSSQPIHVDELQVQCDLPVSTISASLAMLELKGQARQVGGMHYVRARETQAVYRVD